MTTGSLAASRLAEERKNWRKDHPFGFVAKPVQKEDGSTDLFMWKCLIPGKEGTEWDGGAYPLTLRFPPDYPSVPPRVFFPAGFCHPNVFPQGDVCLSIINPNKGWKPSITVRQILVGVADLLADPNVHDPANEIYRVYKYERKAYDRLVLEQAKRYAAPEDA